MTAETQGSLFDSGEPPPAEQYFHGEAIIRTLRTLLARPKLSARSRVSAIRALTRMAELLPAQNPAAMSDTELLHLLTQQGLGPP